MALAANGGYGQVGRAGGSVWRGGGGLTLMAHLVGLLAWAGKCHALVSVFGQIRFSSHKIRFLCAAFLACEGCLSAT